MNERFAQSGIIPVYKPAGMTSHAVVNRARRALDLKRVGHTGTLDPAASGVLVLLYGKATRLSEYLMNGDKEYIAQFKTGLLTDTLDLDGKVLEEEKTAFTADDIEQALKSFIGETEQIPPMFSAIKIGGRKLCDMARKGLEVERAPRKVAIYSAKLTCCSVEEQLFTIKVACSKGTYIRTLCCDIARSLGSFASVTELVRTKSGGFGAEDCITIEKLCGDLQPEDIFRPDRPFSDMRRIELSDEDFRRLTCGMEMNLAGCEPGPAVFYSDNVFLAQADIAQDGSVTVNYRLH